MVSKQDKAEIKKIKLDYLYKEAFISAYQRRRINFVLDDDAVDLKAFQKLSDIENNITSFVREGKHLYIFSEHSGNGKSAWALRMVQSYFEKIWYRSKLRCRALFIHVPRYLLAIKDDISEKSKYVAHIKKNVLTADIVIWDEIGTKGLTEFEHENILSLINARMDMGKTNIYTSNLSGQELKRVVGNRLFSRAINQSINVEFKGGDKRKA